MISSLHLVFSGELGYSLFAMVGELGSEVARFSWFLFLRFLCLPLPILLLVILGDLVVYGWSLSLLWDCGPVVSGERLLLGVQLSR